MIIKGFVHMGDYFYGDAFFADVVIVNKRPKIPFIGYMELNTGETVLVFSAPCGYVGVIEKEGDS